MRTCVCYLQKIRCTHTHTHTTQGNMSPAYGVFSLVQVDDPDVQKPPEQVKLCGTFLPEGQGDKTKQRYYNKQLLNSVGKCCFSAAV